MWKSHANLRKFIEKKIEVIVVIVIELDMILGLGNMSSLYDYLDEA